MAARKTLGWRNGTAGKLINLTNLNVYFIEIYIC